MKPLMIMKFSLVFTITIAIRVSAFHDNSLTIQVLQRQVLSVAQYLNALWNQSFQCNSSAPDYLHMDRQGNFTDCSEIYEAGYHESGVYRIHLFHGFTTIAVFCDMETVGNFTNKTGWIVIQERINGEVSFARGWKDYVNGFGIPGGEQWIGLENLHHLVKQKRIGSKDFINPVLRIDLEDWDGVKVFIEYDSFDISSDKSDFKILYLGAVGGEQRLSALDFGWQRPFSTFDHNTDLERPKHCEKSERGGWWFSRCYFSNLNGLYQGQKGVMTNDMIFIYDWKEINPNYTSFKHISMKLQWY